MLLAGFAFDPKKLWFVWHSSFATTGKQRCTVFLDSLGTFYVIQEFAIHRALQNTFADIRFLLLLDPSLSSVDPT